MLAAQLQRGQQRALYYFRSYKQVLPQLDAAGAGAEIVHVLNGGDEGTEGSGGVGQRRLALL